MSAGTLFLVVGPSGAGKDTLIDGAKRALAGDPKVVFARRTITRPAGAGGEDHEAIDSEAFAARQRAGGFLLCWNAHGLDYGLPAALADDLAAGCDVIANVSRAVLGEAGAKARTTIVEITAPAEVLAARLARRGREDAADIAARLSRAGASYPAGMPVVRVVNDASPEIGIDRFLAALGHARANA